MAGAPHDPPSVGVLPTDEQHAADLIDLRIGTEGLSLLAAGSVPLQELLTRVAEYAVRAVPGADGAGVTMFDSGHPDTVVASASFVAELDVIQYRLMEGPCVTAAAEAHTVRSGSLGGERLWPRFGPRAGRLGIHSALSVPLVLADDVLGAIN
ncbi:MAG: GAF domain-containing protein, partial [Actinobacteria bacterium]|nr:GAF domain-containing protein [Actinomycetota bacterium]